MGVVILVMVGVFTELDAPRPNVFPEQPKEKTSVPLWKEEDWAEQPIATAFGGIVEFTLFQNREVPPTVPLPSCPQELEPVV
jgi:hypothetical protein